MTYEDFYSSVAVLHALIEKVIEAGPDRSVPGTEASPLLFRDLLNFGAAMPLRSRVICLKNRAEKDEPGMKELSKRHKWEEVYVDMSHVRELSEVYALARPIIESYHKGNDD